MRLIAATTLLFLCSTAVSAAESYTLDPNHTNIVWQANHFGFSSPSGRFTKQNGSVVLDEKAPAASKLDVTIDTASIMTGIEKFDAHLKGPDFFDSEKFPTARFVSTKVEVTSEKKAKVTGDLTLRGVTKPVVLDVTLNKIGENPISKKKTAGFSASTTIKRSEFGMSYALPGVSDEVQLMIEAEAMLADTVANAISSGKASSNSSVH